VFARAPENPILAPTPLWWESVAVFNPGVVQDAEGIIHLLYRATGRDGISRLGYAQTRDGVTIKARSREPVFEPEFGNELETFGVEDPRIVFLDGTYYVTYTAASQYRIDDPHPELVPPQEQPWGAGEPWRVRISLALTKDFRSFTRHGVILPDVDNKDGVLFPERVDGQYVLLHRLPPDIWIAYSTDLRDWRGHRAVLRTRPAYWDEQKLGAGAPPLCIDEGWLLLYHGSDHHNVYRAGFVLLDGRDPSRVLGRSEAPALEPLEPYEVGGRVPRVVFPTGVVRRGDTILMYYGAADTVVGVARASLKNVLSSLRS
jgi:predicted GH43/DUF377 family glycosyl hydrolase